MHQIMTRRLFTAALLLTASLTMAGCGKKQTDRKSVV